MTEERIAEKVCKDCGIAKPLDDYYAAKRNLDGLAKDCRVCFGLKCKVRRLSRIDEARAQQRDYARENRAAATARHAAWRSANRARRRNIQRRYAERNAERIREQSMARREADPEARKAAARKENARRRADPAFVMRERIANQLRSHLGSRKAGRPISKILDYTPQELMAHLERQFLKGMNWDNYGEWHIDHIIPASSFTFTGPDDPELRRAWALPNLRPLWARENMSKGAKLETLL